jgi:hypothetical protein
MGVGGYTYSTKSTKRLGVITECIPTSFLQRRPSQLCIYSLEKHLGATVQDTYQGYANQCVPSTLHHFLIQWIDDEIEVVHANASAYIALVDASAN